jgi:hypothetical protein
MAEIKIERKKGVPIWALLLALVLLVVLVCAALAVRNNNHRQAPQNTAVLQWTVRTVPAAAIAPTEPTEALARCA